MKKDNLIINKKKFKSRLIVGTGKYKSFKETALAVKASGAEIVTVAVRRVNVLDKKKPLLMDYLNPKKIVYLPNTAGCYNSIELDGSHMDLIAGQGRCDDVPSCLKTD